MARTVTDTAIVDFLERYCTALEVEGPNLPGDGWPYFNTAEAPTLRASPRRA